MPSWFSTPLPLSMTTMTRQLSSTSDGDFACLVEFLIERKKLKKILTPTGKYSSLMGKYRDHIVLIKNIKSKIADRSPAKKGQ